MRPPIVGAGASSVPSRFYGGRKMSKVALISDIHANLEALTAVFDDIDRQGDIDAVYCLGDLVGYGPDPAQVVDLVRERCEFTLKGNHDLAIVTMPVRFSTMAASAIRWQRQLLDPAMSSRFGLRERWDFLSGLPEEMVLESNSFVHASPRDKVSEYILPRDVQERPDKLIDILDRVEVRCFVGHTHIPGVFLEGPRFLPLQELGYEYEFVPGEKAIVNVSSVGQPRDWDPRACYAVLTEAGVKWIRVAYDVETTVEKVKATAGLDDRCGLRLLGGR